MAQSGSREASAAKWLLGIATVYTLLQVFFVFHWNDGAWARWASSIGLGLLLIAWLTPTAVRLQAGAGAFSLLLCLQGAQAFLGRRWISQSQGAAQAGRVLDNRTPQEAVDDYRRRGIDATIAMLPAGLYRARRRWINLGGTDAVSLGGISRALTVYCNELGYYADYVADEHGFNNPRGLWNPGAVDLAFVGDSFTQATCMNEPDTIPGRMRSKIPAILNLGMGGNGPLLELAGIREYLAPMRPRRVLWMFYQNDIGDLEVESGSAILRRYLDPAFRAGLIDNQAEIDVQLRQARDELEKTAPRWPVWCDHLGMTRARSPLWLQDVVMGQEVTPSIRLLRLSNLKLLVDARIVQASPKASNGAPPQAMVPLDRILQVAHDEVEGWGGKLYFVYVPSYADMMNPNLQNAKRQVGLAAAQAAELPIIDLYPLFMRESARLAFWAFSYAHFNERGYALAAQGILAALQGSAQPQGLRR